MNRKKMNRARKNRTKVVVLLCSACLFFSIGGMLSFLIVLSRVEGNISSSILTVVAEAIAIATTTPIDFLIGDLKGSIGMPRYLALISVVSSFYGASLCMVLYWSNVSWCRRRLRNSINHATKQSNRPPSRS